MHLVAAPLALLLAGMANATPPPPPPVVMPPPSATKPKPIDLPAPKAAAQGEPATYDLRQFTCPIGGQKFSHDVGYFAYPLLTLPDGSWLGDQQIGVQVPVCPDNGLVLLPDYDPYKPGADGMEQLTYVEYSSAEIAQLPALIASPEYKALAAEGRYVQAWWIATKLGRPAYGRFHLLQRSTWATLDPVLRRKLVERFVAEAPALIAAAEAPDAEKLGMQLMLANALRELGRFDEARALFTKLAAGQVTEAEQQQTPFYRTLEQRDDGRIPAELAPNKLFHDLCSGGMVKIYGPLTEGTMRGCKARLDREAKESADQDAAIEMNFDKPARAQMCAETPPGSRTGAQVIACQDDQRDKDQAAGLAMLDNGLEVARQCGTQIDMGRDGALGFACLSYRTALSDQLGDLLAHDDEAWAIMCPGADPEVVEDRDRAAYVDEACRTASYGRKRLAAERLLADPARMAGICQTVSGYSDETVEEVACGMFFDAEIQRLAGDQADFNATCARYGKRLTTLGSRLDDQGERCADAYYYRRNIDLQHKAEARGKRCLGDPNYSRDLPTCLTPAEYEKEVASRSDLGMMGASGVKIALDRQSSLSQAARQQAEQIVAQAKVDRTYPKRQTGDDLF